MGPALPDGPLGDDHEPRGQVVRHDLYEVERKGAREGRFAEPHDGGLRPERRPGWHLPPLPHRARIRLTSASVWRMCPTCPLGPACLARPACGTPLSTTSWCPPAAKRSLAWADGFK